MGISRKQYKLKDKKIKLYQVAETTDEMGQSIQGLALVGEIWAYYRQIGGSEYYELHKTDVKEDAAFVINYRKDVDSHSIITYGDKVYEVTRTDDYEGYTTDLYVYATWKRDKTVEQIEDLIITPPTPEPEPDPEPTPGEDSGEDPENDGE